MSVITNQQAIEKITGQRVAFAGCMASGKSYSAKYLKKKWWGKTHILSLSSQKLEGVKNLFFFSYPYFDYFFTCLPISVQ